MDTTPHTSRFSVTASASMLSPVEMASAERPSRSIRATRDRISASESVETVASGLDSVRGMILDSNVRYVFGSLLPTASKYATPPNLSNESSIASFKTAVVLFGVPAFLPAVLCRFSIVPTPIAGLFASTYTRTQRSPPPNAKHFRTIPLATHPHLRQPCTS